MARRSFSKGGSAKVGPQSLDYEQEQEQEQEQESSICAASFLRHSSFVLRHFSPLSSHLSPLTSHLWHLL